MLYYRLTVSKQFITNKLFEALLLLLNEGVIGAGIGYFS